jgi:hypothetical protein
VVQGSEDWVSNMNSSFHEEFVAAKPLEWKVPSSDRAAGYVRASGSARMTAGNQTFVALYEAGYVLLSSKLWTVLIQFVQTLLSVRSTRSCLGTFSR